MKGQGKAASVCAGGVRGEAGGWGAASKKPQEKTGSGGESTRAWSSFSKVTLETADPISTFGGFTSSIVSVNHALTCEGEGTQLVTPVLPQDRLSPTESERSTRFSKSG